MARILGLTRAFVPQDALTRKPPLAPAGLGSSRFGDGALPPSGASFGVPCDRNASAPVRGLQPLEHREVSHVARSEIGPELLGSCRDDKVGTADPRMTFPPLAPEFP